MRMTERHHVGRAEERPSHFGGVRMQLERRVMPEHHVRIQQERMIHPNLEGARRESGPFRPHRIDHLLVRRCWRERTVAETQVAHAGPHECRPPQRVRLAEHRGERDNHCRSKTSNPWLSV